MNDTAKTLITLGVLLLIGLVTDTIGRRTRLPRVTLLLIFGFAIGPAGLDFLSPSEGKWFSVIADMALVMIGFLLGEKLTLSSLRQHGKFVLWLSVCEVVGTALVVLVGLILIGVQIDIALLLAGIAAATDPAATTDVVHETKADGVFARTLLGIVAVDDAWGLIVFSLILTTTQVLGGQGNSIAPLLTGAWELGGALLVGIGLGIPMAFLTGRIKPGEPTLIEALGVVFLCGGIAIWLEVSFLLASMVLGTVVANLARHHMRPFHAIQGIEWPFMILFFLLAGASLHVGALYQLGLVGSGYIILRIIGRLLGAWAGGAISHAEPLMRRWMGMALMPQAGVALGMALVATHRRPDLANIIFPVVIASTVLFEVIGPVLTRSALVHVGKVSGK
ncbi:MAG: cation:proton antiporter [Deltaproteobacteria bacterium]|nr:MAG: cation:proton antiporter [Deltaproteobacteria bacterium]